MRFRLRTLMIAVTILAVLVAVGTIVLDSWTPRSISSSAEGRQVTKQLAAANPITIEIWTEEGKKRINLTPDSKQELLDWLRAAIRDTGPAERILLGHIELGTSGAENNWLVLKIGQSEVSVQTKHGTWRGLKRSDFERIVDRADQKGI
jgi:hypothetical protein